MDALPLMASLSIFAGNFAPRGWAFCEGQLLPISQNTALFSLLGTTYGGDGRSTFGLPNLKGRMPIGAGSGSGLPTYQLGQFGGNTSVTLTTNNLGNHTHIATATATVKIAKGNGNTNAANGNALAQRAKNANNGDKIELYVPPASATFNNNYALDTNGTEIAATLANAGGSQPVPVMSPYLVVNYCIATQGTYPSRS